MRIRVAMVGLIALGTASVAEAKCESLIRSGARQSGLNSSGPTQEWSPVTKRSTGRLQQLHATSRKRGYRSAH